jgi:hypothetical protein
MELGNMRQNIEMIAKDKALHMFFPVVSNHKGHRAFRLPEDGQPFGFDFKGITIEVHCSVEMRRVKGTGVFHAVPRLSIYGVVRDGRLHKISEVLATEGVV